jgi:hypothetical protein
VVEEVMDLFEEQIALIRRSFGFLESELGLRLERDIKKRQRFELVYVNDVAGVDITYEPRDLYVHVMLCRLTDGKFERDPRFFTAETELKCFDLNDLVQLSNPADMVRGYELYAPSPPGGVEGIIKDQAENLRRYGGGILAGDFSVFPDLDRIVKARAREQW